MTLPLLQQAFTIQLRFIVTTLITFLFVTSTVLWRKAIAVLLSAINKVDKFMRRFRFWLLGIVSFVIATITTVFVSGSFLNRLVLAASCTIFSFNSTFCTPDLEVESDRAMAFESFNDNEGHRGITIAALGEIDIAGSKFQEYAKTEIERADRQVDLKEEYLDLTPDQLIAQASAYVHGMFSDDFNLPYKHFSNEQFNAGSVWLKSLKEQVLDQLEIVTKKDKNETTEAKYGAGKQARQLLGQALHTVQDFYAHSNWIELGYISGTNKDLGVRQLCSYPDQILCAGSNDPVAKKVLQRLTLKQEQNPTPNIPDHVRYAYYDKSILDPDLKKLTSGYFIGSGPIESCETPKEKKGKVIHGTIICNGFNHDDPKDKLYPIAKALAIEASKDYTNLIIGSLMKKDKENGFERVKALMGIEDPQEDAPCNQPTNQSKSENKEEPQFCIATARSSNDPHLVTFDGMKYDLQTVGEVILIHSNHGAFEVQARQTPWNNSASVSINSAVAMKVGSDRVALYAQGLPDDDTTTSLRVNGKPTTIQGNKLSLKGGGEIVKQGGNYVISAPTGEKALVSSSGSFLNISPIVHNRSGKYSGLLGNVNGKPNDDLQVRGGKNVLEARSTYGDVKQVVNLVGLRLPGVLDRAEQVYFDQLYKEFANSWRVKQEESLFDYPAGKTTKSYLNPGFPDKYLTLNMLSADQIQKAQNACTEAKVTEDLMEGCIFDVGFSGFTEFARTTAEISGYIGIVNQLIPGLNIPTPDQVVNRVIEKIKPKVCLPFVGCI